MKRIKFDEKADWATDYLLWGHADGEKIQCVATRHVLVDCLGPDIAVAWPPQLLDIAQRCRKTLEYAFCNKIAAGRFDPPVLNYRGRAAILTHDNFFHWANELSTGPPCG